MSKKIYTQKGNALVTLIAAILISTVIYFLLIPEQKKKLLEQEKEKLPSVLANQLGESTNRPLPKPPTAPYNGILSWSNKDSLTINPFKNSTEPSQKTKPKLDSTATPSPINVPTKENQNLILLSPLGIPFPKKSGYLSGYELKYTNGSLTTSIDNTKGDSDLIVFLKYHGRINTTVTNDSKLARAFFVRKGDKFDAVSLDSGAYSMVWVRLKDGVQAPTQPFLLYKDVKFLYNRIIKFN